MKDVLINLCAPKAQEHESRDETYESMSLLYAGMVADGVISPSVGVAHLDYTMRLNPEGQLKVVETITAWLTSAQAALSQKQRENVNALWQGVHTQ